MRDLTNLKTYIIDSEDPQEVDDAISLEITADNVYKLWVHISNPCILFKFGSLIDEEARRKNCSLYLTEEYIPMLPVDIISKANLQQNKISETISTSIEFKEDGSIKNYELIEAKIRPKYQLTYEDVDEIIELEPNEEFELVELKKLLLNSFLYRKKCGAISFENLSTNIKLEKGKIILNKIERTISKVIVSEAMILMGYVTSMFLINNNLTGAFRSQKFICNPNNVLEKYKESQIKYIILKQYMGKSFISTKPSKHECLGLSSYVQCTSPLRRYLDLIIQRQVYNKLNHYSEIDNIYFSNIIENSKSRQLEINNIYKNDKIKYLIKFFKQENNKFYKIIFVKWINKKRNIALVYFPDYLLETLIILYVSIDIYSNKIYKIKYYLNDSNQLEFIY